MQEEQPYLSKAFYNLHSLPRVTCSAVSDSVTALQDQRRILFFFFFSCGFSGLCTWVCHLFKPLSFPAAQRCILTLSPTNREGLTWWLMGVNEQFKVMFALVLPYNVNLTCY